MSDIEHAFCESCGQRIGYRSTVSKGIVKILEKVAEAIEEKGINVIHVRKELVDTGKMSLTQHNNLTHLTRLGLLANVDGEVGNYLITAKGMHFLNGGRIPREVTVQKATKDKGSHVIDRSDETCSIHDFMGKGEYWIVPGFEIREGRIIKNITQNQ